MKKVVWICLFCFYVVITILITYSLLSYNKYNIAVIGNRSLIIYEGENYKKSDLIVVKGSNSLNSDDKVFYYKSNEKNVEIKLGTITKVNGNNSVIIDDQNRILNSDVIGKTTNASKIWLIGAIYSLLVSKLGYLLIIILPMLIGFFFEIYRIVIEMKRKKNYEKKQD